MSGGAKRFPCALYNVEVLDTRHFHAYYHLNIIRNLVLIFPAIDQLIGAIIIYMSEDQFTKLFKYMQNQFDLVNQKLDLKSSQESLDRLTNTKSLVTHSSSVY